VLSSGRPWFQTEIQLPIHFYERKEREEEEEDRSVSSRFGLDLQFTIQSITKEGRFFSDLLLLRTHSFDLLGFINKSKLQQKLNCTSDRTFQSRRNPGMGEARALSDEDEVLLSSIVS